jgi:hypothetical protein
MINFLVKVLLFAAVAGFFVYMEIRTWPDRFRK